MRQGRKERGREGERDREGREAERAGGRERGGMCYTWFSDRHNHIPSHN